MKDFAASLQGAYSTDVTPKLDNWEDVKAVVEKMMQRLEQDQNKNKFRRATGQLRTFSRTLHKHQTALKMLPAGSEYVSVFYGALATVIQVSVLFKKCQCLVG